MTWTRKHLLGIETLTKQEILHIIDTAWQFKDVEKREVKKLPTLRGKTVINLFFESSTRTRTSFEIAAKRLSADVINFSAQGSSVEKGESLLDTARNIEAMGPDIIVCRHASAGVPHWLADKLRASVINAGDGAHEHPTQALLDAMTILEVKKSLQGLNIAIVGDIAHSRVARSDIFAFQKLGARVCVVGPASMVPRSIEGLGVEVHYNLIEGICDADVIMMLRIQRERFGIQPFPSLAEYARFFGLDEDVMKACKSDVVIMHPGPVNLGVEIDPQVADGPYSVILHQVANGVAVRMALLYLLLGGQK